MKCRGFFSRSFFMCLSLSQTNWWAPFPGCLRRLLPIWPVHCSAQPTWASEGSTQEGSWEMQVLWGFGGGLCLSLGLSFSIWNAKKLNYISKHKRVPGFKGSHRLGVGQLLILERSFGFALSTFSASTSSGAHRPAVPPKPPSAVTSKTALPMG